MKMWSTVRLHSNKPLKFVPATKKNVASTGLANARRLAGRYVRNMGSEKEQTTILGFVKTLIIIIVAIKVAGYIGTEAFSRGIPIQLPYAIFGVLFYIGFYLFKRKKYVIKSEYYYF